MIQIALANGHAWYRQLAKNKLEQRSDFNVTIEAETGSELIHKITQTGNLPDICIIDIAMAGLNGYETLQLLLRKWPSLKVVILTSINHPLALMFMVSFGAAGYLNSEFPVELSHQVLEDVTNGIHWFPAALTNRLNDFLKSRRVKKLSLFTARETEYFQLSCKSLSRKEIAAKMGISVRTAEGYCKQIFDKLGISTAVELALFAYAIGMRSHLQ